MANMSHELRTLAPIPFYALSWLLGENSGQNLADERR